MPTLDLAPDFESQIDRRGRHLIHDQQSHGVVNRRTGDRPAVRFAAGAVRPIADVPSLQSTAPRGVSHAEMPPASSTDGTSL